MARELIVATNPARRRRKKGRSAAQRAAALRNLRKARAARKSPSRKVRRRRNPARAVSTRRIRRRSNPARSGGALIPRGFVNRQLIPAAIGGAGAVANDVAYNMVLNMLPAGFGGGLADQLRTGFMRHVGKVGSALALAYVARMVTSRRNADTMAAGALTVIGYNIVRDGMARFAPTLPLGDVGAYIPPVGLGYAGAGYAPAGTLNMRYGSNYNRGTGLAAYIRPRLAGLSNAQAFGVPRQIAQPSTFAPSYVAPAVAEGYSEEYGGG